MSVKLNVLLAKTEHSSGSYKKMVADYLAFFKGQQGQFRGIKKTYTPNPDTVDIPSERGAIKVVTTVGEKLAWFEDTAKEHINNLFAVEATNASGEATATLVVDGVTFGIFTSLELLRLKSLLEDANLEAMYANIPVRSDSEIWDANTQEEYSDREILQSPLQEGIKKSIMKTQYILEDPNVQHLKDASRYVPQVASKDTVLELGKYTVQGFSGESTHRKRAEILKRRSKLLSAVVEALKTANEAETVQSQLTAEKLFSYLHRGEL